MSFIPFLAVDASAGSGKTYALSLRYICLMTLGASVNKILALTFTNKAAAEMSERILNVLDNLETHTDYISAQTGLSKEQIIAKKQDLIDEFLNQDNKILTIDAFLSKVLRNFSLNVGLAPDFDIAAPNQETLLSDFLSLLNKTDSQKLIELLLLMQIKTPILFDIFELIKQKGANFTPISPQELNETKILKLAHQIKTAVKANDKASSTALKQVDFANLKELLAKSWIIRDSLNYSTFSKVFTPELDSIFYKLKDEIAKYFKTKEELILKDLFYFYEIYKKSLKTHIQSTDALNFSDVESFVADILSSNDKDFIYFRLDSKIEHILIDEFQDTSNLQLKILEPMIDEILAGIGVNDELKSFFLVGDVKQSIYRFRGASAELFGKTIQEKRLETQALETNYRSSTAIVNFANDTFKDRYSNYFIQKTKQDAKEGYVCVKSLEIEQKNDFLLECLKDLLARNYEPNSIGILVFTNDDAKNLSDLLRLNNIKSVTDTSKRLIEQAMPRAIIEFIKYVYSEDEISLASFNHLVGLGEKTLPNLPNDIKHQSPLKIAKNLISNYNFSIDANLVKFLDEIRNFDDIFEFVEKIEQNTAAIDKGFEDGVNILTVHKSKGLAFDCVIVYDRSTKPKNQTNYLIFDERVNYYQKNHEFFSPAYKRLIEKEQNLKQKDNLNLQYVAFTRAKEEMFIIKNTQSELIANDTIVGTKAVLPKQPKIAFKPTKEVQLNSFGKQTQFLSQDEKNIKINPAHIYLGEALHFMLEIMDGFSADAMQTAYMATQNQYGLLADMPKIKQMVQTLISDKEFQALTNCKISKEVPIVHNEKLFIIDLLCENKGVYTICDYKTGVFSPTHITQVQNYIKALQEIKPNATIKACIIYISDKKIEIKGVSLENSL